MGGSCRNKKMKHLRACSYVLMALSIYLALGVFYLLLAEKLDFDIYPILVLVYTVCIFICANNFLTDIENNQYIRHGLIKTCLAIAIVLLLTGLIYIIHSFDELLLLFNDSMLSFLILFLFNFVLYFGSLIYCLNELRLFPSASVNVDDSASCGTEKICNVRKLSDNVEIFDLQDTGKAGGVKLNGLSGGNDILEVKKGIISFLETDGIDYLMPDDENYKNNVNDTYVACLVILCAEALCEDILDELLGLKSDLFVANCDIRSASCHFIGCGFALALYLAGNDKGYLVLSSGVHEYINKSLFSEDEGRDIVEGFESMIAVLEFDDGSKNSFMAESVDACQDALTLLFGDFIFKIPQVNKVFQNSIWRVVHSGGADIFQSPLCNFLKSGLLTKLKT